MYSKENFKNFSKAISITFKNAALAHEALTHRSFLNETQEEIQHNERLEFLGDAVLELIVTEYLFDKYTNFTEGQLTSLRSALVRTESLAEEAKRLDLGQFIYMSNGEEATGGRDRDYILANTVEAIIGAIYLDRGYNKARDFVIKNICHKVEDIVENRLDIDSKSLLQEVSQEKVKITPSYQEIKSIGPDHDKKFIMAVVIGDNIFGRGEGKSKQQAEQNAAKDALENWNDLEKQHFPKE